MEPVSSHSGSGGQNFEFAFNESNFSDRVLRIEIVSDPPECTSGGDAAPQWARHCKRRREDVMKHKALEPAASSSQLSSTDCFADENHVGEAAYMVESPSGDDNSPCSDSPWYMGCSLVKVTPLFISSAILAAKSLFFYKLFSNRMCESEERYATLRINASEEVALMELLNFMYSGKLSTS